MWTVMNLFQNCHNNYTCVQAISAVTILKNVKFCNFRTMLFVGFFVPQNGRLRWWFPSARHGLMVGGRSISLNQLKKPSIVPWRPRQRESRINWSHNNISSRWPSRMTRKWMDYYHWRYPRVNSVADPKSFGSDDDILRLDLFDDEAWIGFFLPAASISWEKMKKENYTSYISTALEAQMSTNIIREHINPQTSNSFPHRKSEGGVLRTLDTFKYPANLVALWATWKRKSDLGENGSTIKRYFYSLFCTII